MPPTKFACFSRLRAPEAKPAERALLHRNNSTRDRLVLLYSKRGLQPWHNYEKPDPTPMR